MRLSIVTCLYKSEAYIEEFYSRIIAILKGIGQEFEIIFVNDGSPDASLSKAIAIFRNDPNVKILDLSRNFGHYRAMMTGVAESKGDFVFLIDADLEEPPELLGAFYKKLMENPDLDVVFGVLESRKGGFLERLGGTIFYKIFNFLARIEVPENASTIRLMRRNYANALVLHKEKEIFMAGLWALTGFNQVGVPFKKGYKGTTSYGILQRYSVFLNALISFSNKPLVLIFYIGAFILFLSSAAAGLLVFRWCVYGDFLVGWPSLIVSIWLLGGMNIFCMGILGYYLSRVFTETKDRPYVIIRRVYGHQK